jgi:hypothetical protein
MMGGRIGMQSQPGVGSAFSIDMPAEKRHARTEAPESDLGRLAGAVFQAGGAPGPAGRTENIA